MSIENCLGGLKAQTDDLLFKGAFYSEINAYGDAMNDHYIIIKGRKGSGKSAIAKVLQKKIRDEGNICEFITPQSFEFSQFDSLYESCKNFPGFPFDYMLRNVWSTIIFSTAMKSILENKWFNKYITRPDDLQVIKDFLKKLGVADKHNELSYIKVCDIIVKTIKNQGYESSPGPFEAIKNIMGGDLREKSIEALKRIVDGSGRKLYLFIDETDNHWGESKNRDAVIRFLAGLLETLHDIHFDEYTRKIYPDKLFLKVLIRDEGYSTAPISNSRVMNSRSTKIEWDRSSLFKMICSRIGIATGHPKKEPNFVWQTIFPEKFTFDVQRHAFDFLLDFTFNRPRDLIDLCQRCINKAVISEDVKGKGKKIIGKVSEKNILEALEEYSNYFVEDEIVEAKVVFPECSQIIEYFTAEPWVEKPQYFIKLLEEICEQIKYPMDRKNILQKLFDFGFFGAILKKPMIHPSYKSGMERIFWYHNRMLRLQNAEYLVIQRVFHVKCSLGEAEDPLNIWTNYGLQ